MPEIDKAQLAERLEAWVSRYRTGSYEVPVETLYADCRWMLATINDLMERLEEVLAEKLAEPAATASAAPELPWALHTPEGYRLLRVNVWPSLEAPRTVALTVADDWAEFTAEEIEEGIAAMTEAVRRIRAHESRKDVAEALPSDSGLINCPNCPGMACPIGNGEYACPHCMCEFDVPEPGCGKTSEGKS